MTESKANLLVGLFSTVEAAAYVGLHPQSIRTYAKRGKIANIQRGRQYFFRREDLDQLFKFNGTQSHDNSIN